MAKLDRGAMWEASKQILRENALENGVIVAANSLYQSPTAVSYHFMWGRDTAKQLLAMHALEMTDAPEIRERFLGWVLERVPGGDSSKLLRKRNHLNGPDDLMFNSYRNVQPDNNGSLLTAINATRSSETSLDNKVMRALANGLASKWDLERHCFTFSQEDQWENFSIDAGGANFFTHGLLSAAHGLRQAADSLQGKGASDSERSDWAEASDQMYSLFTSVQPTELRPYYLRELFSWDDVENVLDGGIVLAIPDLLPDDAPEHVQTMAAQTVEAVGWQLLERSQGVRRYAGDIYDGIETIDGWHGGAGAWPLLGYAWVRAMRSIGHVKKANMVQEEMDDYLRTLYDDGVLPEYHVPEQLYVKGDQRNGKSPIHFGWGTAEWVLAEKDRRARIKTVTKARLSPSVQPVA